ncbi:MAG: MraY family glycosyltransferase, partial [Candidatus Methylumidiphilus sp.]
DATTPAATMHYFVLFLTALFVCTVFVAVLIKLAVPLQFVDIPDHRKVHAAAIPRVGGIGMVAGTLLALWLWQEPDPALRGLFAGIAALSIFGILDDRFNLHYRTKLLGQFIAVLMVVSPGNILIKNLSFFGLHSLPDAVAYPLTVVFLLGTTNAMNLSDGLDGLAAGLSVLSLACMTYLAWLADGDGIIAVCIAIIGATLGFLRYNTHPALAFMGDTGSQFLGFLVGVLAVSLTQSCNTALSGVLPLLILGLPIVDTVRVMGERIAHKASPFKADRNHFHHKLLAMGFDHYESVLVIYVIQAVFITLVFTLRYESDLSILGIYALVFALLCGFFPLANALGWRRRALTVGEQSLLARALAAMMGQSWLASGAYVALSVAVPAFLLSGAVLNPTTTPDLGLFAALMLAAWVLSLASRIPALAATARIAMYSCVTLVMYGIGLNEIAHAEMEGYFRHAVAGLAVLVAVGVVFSPRDFGVTPSDYLVMSILVASASLPVFQEINYARLVAEGAVVLYALEYVLRRRGLGVNVLQGGCLLALAAVALQGYGVIPTTTVAARPPAQSVSLEPPPLGEAPLSMP